MKITASTHEALEAVKRNYEAHKAEYQNQLVGWQEKMKEYGGLLSEWAEADTIESNRPKQPSKPGKYDSSYRRIIKQLEVHTGVEVALEDHEFDQIFLDRFNWKSEFHHNSSVYTGRLAGAGDYDDGNDFT